MYIVGDQVRYMEPLDADYSYGEIIEIKPKVAVIRKVGLYHAGYIVEIPYRLIQRHKRR